MGSSDLAATWDNSITHQHVGWSPPSASSALLRCLAGSRGQPTQRAVPASWLWPDTAPAVASIWGEMSVQIKISVPVTLSFKYIPIYCKQPAQQAAEQALGLRAVPG